MIAGVYGIQGEQKSYEMPLRNQNVAEYTRGTGVAELALAIEIGKKNRANVGMAIHIFGSDPGHDGICEYRWLLQNADNL